MQHSLKLVAALAFVAALIQPASAQHTMDLNAIRPDRKNVAVLLYEKAIIGDFAPAAEVFRIAGQFGSFNVYTVAESKASVRLMWPESLTPRFDLNSAPSPDIIIVPGGEWSVMDDTRHAAVGAWLRGSLAKGARIMSVCTGAYVLAQFGLLDGRDATSLHAQMDLLAKLAPKARVHPKARYVVSGPIVTTAGDYTSIDAALMLVTEIAGEKAALWAAHTYMDYEEWDPKVDRSNYRTIRTPGR